MWDRAVSLRDFMTRELDHPVVEIGDLGIYVGWFDGPDRVIGLETFWGHSDDVPHYYAGEWHRGKLDGLGRLEHGDAVYVGETTQNTFHGTGVAVDGDHTHEGFFRDNKPAGTAPVETVRDTVDMAIVVATAAALALRDALETKAVQDACKEHNLESAAAMLSDVQTMALAPAALARGTLPRASSKRRAHANKFRDRGV